MKIKSPLHLPHKGECSAATCSRTSRTSPRTKAEHSPSWGRWRGLKNINNLPTFPLPRKPQNPPRKGESDPSSLPARRYNKAVGGFPYCAGQQNKEASRHNKETDREVRTHFRKNMTEKEGKTMKNSTTCYFLHHFIKSVTPKSGQKLMQKG